MCRGCAYAVDAQQQTEHVAFGCRIETEEQMGIFAYHFMYEQACFGKVFYLCICVEGDFKKVAHPVAVDDRVGRSDLVDRSADVVVHC